MHSNAATKEEIQKVVDKHKLDLLVLFGPQVTGYTHSESDHDVAYLSKHGKRIDEEGALINALMNILLVQDERKVNLVTLKKVIPLMLLNITDNAKVLF